MRNARPEGRAPEQHCDDLDNHRDSIPASRPATSHVVRLTLRSKQPKADVDRALRRLLKYALRSCYFRCVAIAEGAE